MFRVSFRAAACAALLVAAVPAAGADPAPAAVALLSGDAAEAAAAVDAFHAALARGDTEAALGFLADEALILEQGGAERSKAEYAASHLAADSAFSKAVKLVRVRRAGGAEGGLAWIGTEAHASGHFNGRDIDHPTAETMVLRRSADGWRIVHIHWSSAGS